LGFREAEEEAARLEAWADGVGVGIARRDAVGREEKMGLGKGEGGGKGVGEPEVVGETNETHDELARGKDEFARENVARPKSAADRGRRGEVVGGEGEVVRRYKAVTNPVDKAVTNAAPGERKKHENIRETRARLKKEAMAALGRLYGCATVGGAGARDKSSLQAVGTQNWHVGLTEREKEIASMLRGGGGGHGPSLDAQEASGRRRRWSPEREKERERERLAEWKRQQVRRALGGERQRKSTSVQTEEEGAGGELGTDGQRNSHYPTHVWVPEVIRRGVAQESKHVGLREVCEEEEIPGVGHREGDGEVEKESKGGVGGRDVGNEEIAGQRRRRRQAEARERDFQVAEGPLHVSRVREREKVATPPTHFTTHCTTHLTAPGSTAHLQVKEDGEEEEQEEGGHGGESRGEQGLGGEKRGGEKNGEAATAAGEEAAGESNLLETIAYYEKVAQEMRLEKGEGGRGGGMAGRRRRRRAGEVAHGGLDGGDDDVERGVGLRVAELWESFSEMQALLHKDQGGADGPQTRASEQAEQVVLEEEVVVVKEETVVGAPTGIDTRDTRSSAVDVEGAGGASGDEGAGRGRMEDALRRMEATAEVCRVREAHALHLFQQVQQRERDIEAATLRLRSSLQTLDPTFHDPAQQQGGDRGVGCVGGLLGVVDDVEAYLERVRIQNKTAATKDATHRLLQQLAGGGGGKGAGGGGGCIQGKSSGSKAVVDGLGDEDLENWIKLLSRALLDVDADAGKRADHFDTVVTDWEEWEVDSLGSDIGEFVAESVLLY
jgi:hypothetical protein